MRTNELSGKDNQGIETISIEDSHGNITLDQRQVLKILENYIAEFSIELIDQKT